METEAPAKAPQTGKSSGWQGLCPPDGAPAIMSLYPARYRGAPKTGGALHYHLLGIGGTAMASLAGLLQAAGHRVTGSDENVYPPMSTMLQSLGIVYGEGYGPENLQPRPDMVVVG